MFEVHITAGGVIEGVLMYGIVHGIWLLIKRVIHGTERTAALYWHEIYRKKGLGHEHRSVFMCRDGKCALF